MNVMLDKAPVLFLLGTLEIGGSESKFVALARRLCSAGYPVHVAYLRGPFLLLEKLSEVPHVHLEQKGKWSLHAYLMLRRYVRENRIHAIVTVNPYPLSYAAAWSLDYEQTKVRVIASINTSEFLSKREKRFMRLYSVLLRRCDHVVFGSRNQKVSWLEAYRINGSQTSVIYNGVDSSHYSAHSVKETRQQLRKRFGLPLELPTLVSVGQLRPEKGHLMLLSALAFLKREQGREVFLVLVGDGGERARIEAKIEELGLLNSVKLVGATGDVRPYLKLSDLFVLTSIAVETFSNAALEAAAMELPIVMSDVGGASEMFPNSNACIVYPRNDRQALVAALDESIGRVAAQSHGGASLRRKVLRNYSTQAMDENWGQILWEQLESKTGEMA